ncbi:MAG: hypothetical protein CVU56_15170 [Deltaproteobacteria bacterium HGW-Deltaproteobacteria-14]|jgi:hypothetical protein|nr:MAG: hypothetical protein CVU56_15170 [Deltaproteobacteria bacterium HGW-Deltaproteobacteria-14]
MLRPIALFSAPLLMLSMSLAGGACSADPAASCRVNADCASGVCNADQTCAVVSQDARDAIFVPPDVVAPSDTVAPVDTAGGTDSQAPADTSAAADTAAPADTAPPADTATGPGCVPNGDHVVTRDEVSFVPGTQLRLRVASDVAFDTRPTTSAAGDLRWDLAQNFDGDANLTVPLLDPSAQWFGASFPTATYATRRSAGDELLGVFRADDDALYLLGVVSPADGAARTELVYDPPAKMLSFPLEAGTSWETDSQVSGLSNGAWTYATENWHVSVDLDGTVETPAGAFGAVRLIVGLYRWFNGSFYVEVQQVFVAECEGTVAVVKGHGNDGGPELATASEIRRRTP